MKKSPEELAALDSASGNDSPDDPARIAETVKSENDSGASATDAGEPATATKTARLEPLPFPAPVTSDPSDSRPERPAREPAREKPAS